MIADAKLRIAGDLIAEDMPAVIWIMHDGTLRIADHYAGLRSDLPQGKSKPEHSWERRQLVKQLAKRDGQSCFYCGTPFSNNALKTKATVDHLIPRHLINTWHPAALVLCCDACNTAKRDTLPQELLRPRGEFRPGLVRQMAQPSAPPGTRCTRRSVRPNKQCTRRSVLAAV